MLSDLETTAVSPFEPLSYDVCIIGAGPAGMSLALNLPEQLRILILEAGDLIYSEQSQEQYEGTNIGQEYFGLNQTRLRFFGGSSNHWGGLCRELKDIDFAEKSYAKYSGWPISKKDLDPYFEATKSILDIPGTNDTTVLEKPEWLENLEATELLRETGFIFSEPTRFNLKYRKTIEDSKNIDCYVNANITDMLLDESGQKIDHVVAYDYSNKKHTIRAKQFVLAAGGLENPRILLNCSNQESAGLGNQNDLVGRFFCEHPHYFVGDFILEESSRTSVKNEMLKRNEWRHFRLLEPTEQEMQKSEILNFGIRFQPRFIEGREPDGFKDIIRKVVCTTGFTKDFAEMLTDRTIICASDGHADGTLMVAAEQSLNPSSRVGLSQELDRFGLRKIALDWQLTDMDKKTLRGAALSAAQALATSKVGRVKPRAWLLDDSSEFPGLDAEQVGGHHHMCTTRMSNSPEEGVVDGNLKVHGLENLYVAGSSSFGSPGHVNPTFTIVQLSLRLADHLNKQLI